MGRQRKEQKDLAEALGVTQATISRRLSGERPFSLNDLERLAAYFGVPLASLIRERAA